MFNIEIESGPPETPKTNVSPLCIKLYLLIVLITLFFNQTNQRINRRIYFQLLKTRIKRLNQQIKLLFFMNEEIKSHMIINHDQSNNIHTKNQTVHGF